jgi:hypothetical protein
LPVLLRLSPAGRTRPSAPVSPGDKWHGPFGNSMRPNGRWYSGMSIDRKPNRHLAFGLGVHRCIGSHLAREMFVAMIDVFLDRIPVTRSTARSSPTKRSAVSTACASCPSGSPLAGPAASASRTSRPASRRPGAEPGRIIDIDASDWLIVIGGRSCGSSPARAKRASPSCARLRDQRTSSSNAPVRPSAGFAESSCSTRSSSSADDSASTSARPSSVGDTEGASPASGSAPSPSVLRRPRSPDGAPHQDECGGVPRLLTPQGLCQP